MTTNLKNIDNSELFLGNIKLQEIDLPITLSILQILTKFFQHHKAMDISYQKLKNQLQIVDAVDAVERI